MEPDLRERLTASFGSFEHVRPVGGGDFATAYEVGLADGRRIFVKTHAAPPPGFFTTEAAGLVWLREAAAVAVPEVLTVDDASPAHLVLEWIETDGQRTDATETAFGHALARLHQTGSPSFGRRDGRTTGSLALPNPPTETWAEFYASSRLVPLACIASDRDALPTSTVSSLESIAERLAEFGSADEAPARLHGDLWAGNRLVDSAGRSWLIDPACHGGHREFDLAMMRLFGGFGEAAFAAYDAASPLADGWRTRVDLHQLAPLVVHAIKFGGGYVGAVASALGRLAR